jgi:maltose O-acetyltransferase
MNREEPMTATEHDKMLAGEAYDGSDAELVAMRLRARRLIRDLNNAEPGETQVATRILGELFGSLGPGGWVEPPFRCDYGANIHAGDRLYMNFDCVVLDCGRVDIGDDVLFGPGVHLYTALHPLDPEQRATGPESTRPVRIGSRVWLGGGVIVCPGVTIGDGTTVGAGSVVTRDLPPYVVAAGNPCRVLRSLR